MGGPSGRECGALAAEQAVEAAMSGVNIERMGKTRDMMPLGASFPEKGFAGREGGVFYGRRHLPNPSPGELARSVLRKEIDS
jgi:hypothetical protein